MANLILRPKVETAAVRRGRAMSARLLGELGELRERGRVPTRIVISTAAADDLRAFFDFAASSFDGVLPKAVRGVPLAVEPGVAFGMAVDYRERADA